MRGGPSAGAPLPYHCAVLYALLLHVLQTVSSVDEVAQRAHTTAEDNLLSSTQDQVYAQSLEDQANMLKAEATSVALKRIQGSLLIYLARCTLMSLTQTDI